MIGKYKIVKADKKGANGNNKKRGQKETIKKGGKRGRPVGSKNTRKNEPLFLSRSGVTLQEIAEAVATTPQAVKNILDRGIKTERKKRQILEALERIKAEKKSAKI